MRQKGSESMGSLALWMGGLAAACLLGALIYGMILWDRATLPARFAAEGVETIARVEKAEYSQYKARRSHVISYRYYMTVSFTDTEGVRFTSTAEVSGTTQRGLAVGDDIPIRYLPDDPRKVEIERGRVEEVTWVSIAIAGILGAFGCVFGVLAAAALRAGRREARGS